MTGLTKKEIRQLALARRNALSESERERHSAAICGKLIQLPVFQMAQTVYAYMNIGSEVETSGIIRAAWSMGKRVAVPKTEGTRIRFYYIASLRDTVPGCFHVPEPCGSPETLADCADALIIMPGVAFDKTCSRCGYGKGYYDRYLSEHPGHPTCAVAYDAQLFDAIPVEETDIRPNLLITERRVLGELPQDRI